MQIFGWLCVNYLLKRAGQIDMMGSVGALDLGGGSTQISLADSSRRGSHLRSEIDPRLAAEAKKPEVAAAPRVPLPGGEVSVFTHSHLGFGNKAVLSSLTATEAAACLSAGVNSSWEPCNHSEDYLPYLSAGAFPLWLLGGGDFAACEQGIRRVLTTFDRAGQPDLARVAPTRFVAMSLFFYVQHFAAVAGHFTGRDAGVAISAGALRAAARSLCELDDERLRQLVGVDPLTTEDALRWRCFDLTYAARLLTDGYGFDEDAAVIDFLGEIEGRQQAGGLLLSFFSLLSPLSLSPLPLLSPSPLPPPARPPLPLLPPSFPGRPSPTPPRSCDRRQVWRWSGQ